MSKTAKVITLMIAQAFNALIGFLFLPYLVRAFTVHDYGTYGQALLVSDMARFLFSMGLPSVLYVYLAKSDDVHTSFKSNIGVAVIMGVLGGLCLLLGGGLLTSQFHNDQLPRLVRIQSVTVLFQVPMACLTALLIHSSRVRHVAFNLLFTNALRVGLTILAVEKYHSLPLVFNVLNVVSAIQVVVGVASMPREYMTKGHFHAKQALAQFKEGFHLGLTGLIGISMVFTDRFMVSSMLSVSDFAVFRNGTIDIPLLGTLYSTIASVVLPEISKHYSGKRFDEIVALKRKLITVNSAVIYPMVLFIIVFSGPLVTLYFTQKYAGSAIVFALMTAGLLLRVNDYLDIMVSAAKGRLLMACYAGGFLLNLCASYACIRVFGYWGAALSTLLAQFTLICVLFVLSARLVSKSVLDFIDLKRLAQVVAVSLAFPLAFKALDFHTHQFVFLALYGGTCTLASYLVFLKMGVVDHADVAPLLRKIPIFGAALAERQSSSKPAL